MPGKWHLKFRPFIALSRSQPRTDYLPIYTYPQPLSWVAIPTTPSEWHSYVEVGTPTSEKCFASYGCALSYPTKN